MVPPRLLGMGSRALPGQRRVLELFPIPIVADILTFYVADVLGWGFCSEIKVENHGFGAPFA